MRTCEQSRWGIGAQLPISERQFFWRRTNWEVAIVGSNFRHTSRFLRIRKPALDILIVFFVIDFTLDERFSFSFVPFVAIEVTYICVLLLRLEIIFCKICQDTVDYNKQAIMYHGGILIEEYHIDTLLKLLHKLSAKGLTKWAECPQDSWWLDKLSFNIPSINFKVAKIPPSYIPRCHCQFSAAHTPHKRTNQA